MKFLITLSIFFLAVVIHEFCHGWVAWRLGDPTAKNAGRLTFNPLAHIDPIGTIIVPLFLLIAHLPVVGWAKPVPVNFYNLRNPKRDMIWVGIAGPTANILLAVFLSFILKISTGTGNLIFLELLKLAIVLNLILAIFNILPIPPLDGSRVFMGILPPELSRRYSRLEPYGIFIILALLYLGILGSIIWPLVLKLANLLGADLL